MHIVAQSGKGRSPTSITILIFSTPLLMHDELTIIFTDPENIAYYDEEEEEEEERMRRFC